jgi:hypothetical protein
MRRALVAANLVAALVAPPARAAGDALELATCPGEVGERVATVEGRAVLARAFLDEKLDEEANARLAILQQLRYLWGWLRTRPGDKPIQLVLSAEDPELTITARSVGRYGRDLALDWVQRPPHLVVEDRYTARAIARGRTRADDEALIVEWRARFKVALCSAAGRLPPSLSIPIPDDPWLFYWHLPAARRRLMRYFDESAVTSPCADDDFADLPHPFYLWYDWLPDRHGLDGAGHPFDCRPWLREGVDFTTRTVALAPAPPILGRLPQLGAKLAGSAPLRATVLFGVLDHPVTDPHLAELASELARRPLADAVADANARTPRRERGTRKLLDFLAALPEVMTVRAARISVEQGYLRVQIDGALRRSGRALVLSAWLGLTDLFGPVAPRHWKILADALAADQVVIYAGHSGLGENFRLAQIASHVGLDEQRFAEGLERAPYQLVAFLSCYSYMYFGHDLERAARRSPGRDFVYSGTEFTKGDLGALAVLDLVDQALAPSSAPIGLRFVVPADFLIVKAASAK